MEALGIFWGVDFCPYSIISARVLPPPGSTCLFHSELKHMGGGGGGACRPTFPVFPVEILSWINLASSSSPSLDIRNTAPPPGQHACFTALSSIWVTGGGGGGHCGAIFLFSVEILSWTNPASSSSCHLICGELPRLRVSMLVSQHFRAYRTYFFLFSVETLQWINPASSSGESKTIIIR